MVISNELGEKVKEFSQHILEFVKERVNQGFNFLYQFSVNKPIITQLQNLKDNFYYIFHTEPAIKKEIDLFQFNKFRDDCIELDVYYNLTRLIEKNYKKDIYESGNLIDDLIYHLIEWGSGLSQLNSLDDINNLFINSVLIHKPEWEAKVWINGLWLDCDNISISKILNLKKITLEDIRIKEFVHNSVDILVQKRDYPSIILKCICKGKGEKHVKSEVERYCKLLRLFRLGSVFFRRIEIKKLTIEKSSTLIYLKEVDARWNIKYTLDNDDLIILKDFFNDFNNPRMLKIFNGNQKRTRHLMTAYKRYDNVFLNYERPESVFMYFCSCLESLFLTGNEKVGISRKLNQRISLLLKTFGYEPLKTKRIITKSYSIRSLYSHGSTISVKYLKEQNIENLKDLAIKGLEYTRFCLLILLQVFSKVKKSKDQLIELIDKALLDDSSYQELKNLMETNCKSYIF